MFRVIIISTAIFSFINFILPGGVKIDSTQIENVLGINQINYNINKATVETALWAYCLEKGNLPGNLNNLHPNYLDTKSLHLEELYQFEIIDGENCKFSLV